jgi:hypothetical protein
LSLPQRGNLGKVSEHYIATLAYTRPPRTFVFASNVKVGGSYLYSPVPSSQASSAGLHVLPQLGLIRLKEELRCRAGGMVRPRRRVYGKC